MWYEAEGKDTDVVLYSRVYLSRNIKGFPFPKKMNPPDKDSVINIVRQAVSGCDMNFARVDELDDKAKADIFNQYYAPYEFLNDFDYSAFLLNKEQNLGMLVNGLEHMSIVSFESGNNIEDAYKRAEKLVVGLERQMDIAYSEKLGFLTSDTNFVGTALQVGYLVAIPGIEKTAGALQLLAKRIGQYDWVIETANVNNNPKEPGIFCIHNIATLGVTEQEIINSASYVVEDLIKLERTCRKNIMKKKAPVVEDQYYRAYGILKYARKLEFTEVLNLLSWLRLGQDFIKGNDCDISWHKINMITHITRRDYDTFMDSNRGMLKMSANATKIRKVLKGDEA